MRSVDSCFLKSSNVCITDLQVILLEKEILKAIKNRRDLVLRSWRVISIGHKDGKGVGVVDNYCNTLCPVKLLISMFSINCS